MILNFFKNRKMLTPVSIAAKVGRPCQSTAHYQQRSKKAPFVPISEAEPFEPRDKQNEARFMGS
jgi:hypothetical protein